MFFVATVLWFTVLREAFFGQLKSCGIMFSFAGHAGQSRSSPQSSPSGVAQACYTSSSLKVQLHVHARGVVERVIGF